MRADRGRAPCLVAAVTPHLSCKQALTWREASCCRPMVFELVSWLQTDLPTIDQDHLARALALIPSPPAAQAGEDNGNAAGKEGEDGDCNEDDDCSVATTGVVAVRPPGAGAGQSVSPGGKKNARSGRGGMLEADGGADRMDSAALKALGEEIKAKEEKKRGDAGWKRMQVVRQKLPAWKQAADIVSAVRASSVTVISGETGCGKTTQVFFYFMNLPHALHHTP